MRTSAGTALSVGLGLALGAMYVMVSGRLELGAQAARSGAALTAWGDVLRVQDPRPGVVETVALVLCGIAMLLVVELLPPRWSSAPRLVLPLSAAATVLGLLACGYVLDAVWRRRLSAGDTTIELGGPEAWLRAATESGSVPMVGVYLLIVPTVRVLGERRSRRLAEPTGP